MSFKINIELDFDTFKPSTDDVFQYVKDLYEDNSLDYSITNNKTGEVKRGNDDN